MSSHIFRLISPSRHFLKAALAEAGYKTIHAVSQVSAADLCAGRSSRNVRPYVTEDLVELGIGIPQAEDILRHADSFRGMLQKDVSTLLADTVLCSGSFPTITIRSSRSAAHSDSCSAFIKPSHPLINRRRTPLDYLSSSLLHSLPLSGPLDWAFRT